MLVKSAYVGAAQCKPLTTTKSASMAAAATVAMMEPSNVDKERRLKVLCLHGFRTSGEILRLQIERAKWGSPIMDLMDLAKKASVGISKIESRSINPTLQNFLDGPFPAKGKSEAEEYFAPPYYEWFSPNKDFTEYSGVEECVSYLGDYIKKNGPFDGYLGFSQGAFFASALAGVQDKSWNALPSKVKFVILISGGKFRYKRMAEVAYDTTIECPSLHIVGEKDFLKQSSEALAEAFKDPVVIKHPYGHKVPRLGESSIAQFRGFLLDMLKASLPSEVQLAV